MDAYRDIAADPPVRVALPGGALTDTPGRGIRITLPHNARVRDAIRAIRERLDGAAAAWLWLPAAVDERGDELVVDYDPGTTGSIAFLAALPRVAKAPQIHLPELLGLARYLAAIGTALERAALRVLIAPACLRYAPASDGAWRLVVVPVVDAALADWAAAAPEAWAWTPAAALRGEPAPGATAFAIGAALCTGLTGGLFPPGLPPNAQFVRALRGWIGRPSALAAAVRAALPASFTDEASALTGLIGALLEPAPPPDWPGRLTQLVEQLAPHRTAVRWEYEGRLDVARGILERFAATAPREAVPWEVVARLRGKSNDLDGSLDAAIDALGTGEHAVRDLAAAARRLAHALPPERHRPLLERAIAAADRLGAGLGDLGRLHFAHLEARYLARFTAALDRLAAPPSEPWDQVVCAIVRARIHAELGAWAHVARLCKDARAATRAMPAGGGQLGGYAVAYLDHLDGVAHCGAVQTYRDPGYLADAFDRLVASLEAARQLCEPGAPLIDAGVDWLHTLAELAARHGARDAAVIGSGVIAYLGAQGLVRRTSEPYRRETPPVVWYDAGRLLALSGAP